MFNFAVTWLAAVALGVGALHMVAPDHWVPLTVYSHKKGFSSKKVAIIAALGGFAHVAGSLVVMVAAVVIGFAVAASFSALTNTMVGASFVVVGLYMLVAGMKAPDVEEDRVDVVKGTKWLVFAGASSPELTIFPIYLAANVYGLVGVTISVSAFALGTVLSMVLVTIAGVKGMGRFLRAPGRERQVDYILALVLLALGALVLAGA
ncbi:MAG: hypothetical protein LYZ69_08845 [Nitrososphaerales archaeon]|nr:hypothetical protein [Nitrososphaerales archaeon]